MRLVDEVEISVLITRYVDEVDPDGYLVNADQLIEDELLSPYAFIQIVAGDVDPTIGQFDYVYLNGEETQIGIMSGARLDFRPFTFFFDVRELRFPDGSVDASGQLIPAENTIVIDIDAKGRTIIHASRITRRHSLRWSDYLTC